MSTEKSSSSVEAAGSPFEADRALEPLRARIRNAALACETALLDELQSTLAAYDAALHAASRQAARWVVEARAARQPATFMESLLDQFPLDSEHGRALMSLAEALLRTPDKTRADQLVAERLLDVRRADKEKYGGALARAAFAVLASASRLLPDVESQLEGSLSARSLTRPVVAPLARRALRRAMRSLGDTFIAGETIDAALRKGESGAELSLCSFDMLGEGARTEADAERYLESYRRAIASLAMQKEGDLSRRSGISVKLSAIEPRYSLLQRPRVLERLVPRMLQLAAEAAHANIGLTIDAEEAERLDLSLDIVEALAREQATRDWPGLGLAVQAYSRRAPLVVDWAAALARASRRRMTLRLVKGAYWDTEIKLAQERGLASFPVFTTKAGTDVCYLECSRRLFGALDVIFPQFATHNAYTVAAVLALAPPNAAYEFQRLYGMGEVLYRTVRARVPALPSVRVYAPVGTHEALLPYLVRRLLENGANSSFVHRLLDARVPPEDIVRNPVQQLLSGRPAGAPRIREPLELYAPDRRNSRGADWGDPGELESLRAAARSGRGRQHKGGPIIDGRLEEGVGRPVVSPANAGDVVGLSRDASEPEIRAALDSASRAQPAWNALPADVRAARLEGAAQLLDERRAEFISLLVREAGKTLPDAVAEVREAIDFCRYYAARGRELFGGARSLPGPTGERNVLSLQGRGVFACISPWNFPLAIFTGQITAALMAGNAVVAKPAPATPLIAHAMVRVLHEARVPGEALQLTPADGPAFGAVALRHPALAGVAFTGSTATATTINRGLASRDGAIIPLIAETGGVNAMIVDATALPEQVVDDLIASAFTSAGQRCSAARLVYVQEEIAERVIEMLIGAMKCLVIGDPADPTTDVGPLISAAAVARLKEHVERMRAAARVLFACPPGPGGAHGHFFPPHLIELQRLDQLKTEEFGPLLHVARYRAAQLPQVLEAIRGGGFALTLGVQSRLESLARHVAQAAPVGNLYVNRNMIGAVVGVQPFGGHGLSGTGPKAGGPHYLLRFANERTVTTDLTAIGGNAELLSVAD